MYIITPPLIYRVAFAKILGYNHAVGYRGVAQLGSAQRSGR
jgi:hypothetical protein